MTTLDLVLLVAAIICFLLDAFSLPARAGLTPRVGLTPLGLALVYLRELV